MRAMQIVIVIRTIQVGWHGGNEITAVLPPVCLTKLNPGNFSHCIPFICWLQRTGKEVLFFQRLRRQLRINARAAQEQKFCHARTVSAMDQIVLDLQVLEQEFGRILIVGQTAAHLCRSDKNVFGFFSRVETLDGSRVQKV